MFFSKKKVSVVEYDRERFKPIIRQSICNGEMVGGLKDKESGKFKETMLIRGDDDLAEFKQRYGVTEVDKEY